MAVDPTARREPTRRRTIKGSGAPVAGGLLAGCAGRSGVGGGANGSSGSDSGNTTAGGGSEISRSVTVAPMGEVAFEAGIYRGPTTSLAWIERGQHRLLEHVDDTHYA